MARTVRTADKAVDVVKGVNKATNLSKGFTSFTAFKRAIGSAGKGMEWHHIVEQAVNKGRFVANKLHNIDNIISIPKGIHGKISGFYSRKLPFTGNKTVRQWISTKSFKQQYEYGNKVLSKFIKQSIE